MSLNALRETNNREPDLFIEMFIVFLTKAVDLLLTDQIFSQKKTFVEQNLITSLSLLSNLHESIVSRKLRYEIDDSYTLPFDEKQQLKIRLLIYELKSRIYHSGDLSKTVQAQCSRLIDQLLAYYPPRPNVRIIIECSKKVSPWLAST
ncbi:hypothetical protein P6709_15945 [Jeotgalibacillus sp. ET6]|uniref:hypothetical protein n=1 Tax=Jeotgalibacillus sp. ET6 TaxID=3037260 RepID=UPI002418950E|nr:hypothetical protein [Jeotgalibacillus sp. ET6]MDG5473244.1 hypothetical protein [Jeotgalibacillus sp. ET6]